MAPGQGPDYPAHNQRKRQENGRYQMRRATGNDPGAEESDTDGKASDNQRSQESRPHAAVGEVLPRGFGRKCSEVP
jgi:hypothetical protein